MNVLRTASLLLGCSLLAAPASAQIACDSTACDRVIDASERRVDGAADAAGSTLCVRASDTPIGSLEIRDVSGTADAPVRVIPCGGVLRIGAGSSTDAISIVRSRHLQLSGGDETAIRIEGGDGYSMGIAVRGCTEHLELDHIEVTGTSYTALRNHVADDACVERSGFSVHHLYVHDVGGEGMFLGLNSGTSPNLLRDVEIYENRIERTGYQGIKVGTTVVNAIVRDNVVIEPGARDVGGEDTGITGSAREWRIEGNVVVRSRASCAFLSGGTIDLVNNVFVGCGGPGATFNGAPTRVRIAHNTFVRVGGEGVRWWGGSPTGSTFANNLFLDHPDAGLGPTDAEIWTIAGNLETTIDDARIVDPVDPDAAGYADVATPPFSIGLDSPARDGGDSSLLDVVPTDILGRPRDATPDVGAFEAIVPLPDAGPASPDAGAPEEHDDAGSARGDDASASSPD
ncbi:MAG: right-handed parallel beta-helix repeat-containing protein, partial [Myxococcota bacterium]|nr:right-handed parallel beta-helix repeat-containing protein [Myxococcota bacterium]